MVARRLLLLGLADLSLLLICLQTCSAQTNPSPNHLCAPSSCGNLHNISYPFRLKGDPQNCGFQIYELACENNQTVFYLYSGKYHVQSINYNNNTIRIADASVNKGNCSSLPKYSLSPYNFTYGDRYEWRMYLSEESGALMLFMKCVNPVNSSFYVDTAPCINGRNSYVMVRGTFSDVENLCRVELMAMSSFPIKNFKNISYIDIHNSLAYGFELWWGNVYCFTCNGKELCYPDGVSSPCRSPDTRGILSNIILYLNYMCWSLMEVIDMRWSLMEVIDTRWFLMEVIGRSILFTPFVMAFLFYTWRRRHLSMYDTVEEFLQNESNFMPVRYSYSDIKKMTHGFKDKLGEGGYGSVYKGKLRSGHLAAVKMLGKSKSNGQDFINEVGTIGRIHHVNVVRLIGFCAEGSKRALVYDFMPNGSLDKYVFSQKANTSLSWHKMYEISLGVARGIEYLHQGCDMQILHFDIKPHNILLDENFTPKISDFGLARLYPTKKNTVSLTAARGTIGYIAPELFYKNIGSVSYKADVYSFGMLLMEMTGKRTNVNPVAEDSSENYFPSCVYNEIVDEKVEIGDVTGDEKKMAKKMIIVALWCIQMNPVNRPSMNEVVEMLQGDLESLQLPPKPALFPEEMPIKDAGSTDGTWSSSVLLDSTETISLVISSH